MRGVRTTCLRPRVLPPREVAREVRVEQVRHADERAVERGAEAEAEAPEVLRQPSLEEEELRCGDDHAEPERHRRLRRQRLAAGVAHLPPLAPRVVPPRVQRPLLAPRQPRPRPLRAERRDAAAPQLEEARGRHDERERVQRHEQVVGAEGGAREEDGRRRDGEQREQPSVEVEPRKVQRHLLSEVPSDLDERRRGKEGAPQPARAERRALALGVHREVVEHRAFGHQPLEVDARVGVGRRNHLVAAGRLREGGGAGRLDRAGAQQLERDRLPPQRAERAGGAGTHHAHQRLGRRRHAEHVGLGVGDRRERRRLRRPQPCDAEADAAQRTRRAHVRPRHEHHEVGAAL